MTMKDTILEHTLLTKTWRTVTLWLYYIVYNVILFMILWFLICVITVRQPFECNTLVRLIMTGNIVTGKNNDGYKYGGIAEKPPNLTRHFFTCNMIFTKKFENPPNFTCYIAKFYPIFFPNRVFVYSFKYQKS